MKKGGSLNASILLNKIFFILKFRTFSITILKTFNVNSANIGARFFARADNEKYMSPHLSHRLLAEGTQLSALTGAKTTAYLNANEALKDKWKEFRRSCFAAERLNSMAALSDQLYFLNTLTPT